MTLWLLLAALAEAKKPAPVPAPAPAPVVTASEAAEWMRAVLPQVQAVLAPLRSQVASLAVELDAAAADKRRLALLAAAQAADGRLQAISAFPNDDRVREAARAYAARVAAECQGDLAKWIALRKPIVADADLAEAAAIGLAAEGRIRDADLAYFAAVDAFGAAHNVRLTVARPAGAAEFEQAGLAPAGSAAPPRMVAQLANAYAAQLVPMQRAIDEAYTAWREAVVQWVPLNSPKVNPAAETHQKSRDTVARALAAIGKVEPWLGDPALRDAARNLGGAVTAALDGKGAEVTKKSMAGVQSQREVEALNASLKDVDAQVDAAVASWDAAMAAFRQRWGIDAYERWLAETAGPRATAEAPAPAAPPAPAPAPAPAAPAPAPAPPAP